MSKNTLPSDLSVNQPPSSPRLPARIDLDKWQDLGFTWSGQVSPTDFPRLGDQLDAEHEHPPIKLNVKLAQTGQLLTLHMAFVGDVWVTCQRCLQPLGMPVTHSVDLPLLMSETEQSLLDESDEFLMLDEVVVGEQGQPTSHERWMPLAQLVEDELLLAVPLSAKHEHCEMAVEQVGEIEEAEPDNPFSALADLKGKL